MLQWLYQHVHLILSGSVPVSHWSLVTPSTTKLMFTFKF